MCVVFCVEYRGLGDVGRGSMKWEASLGWEWIMNECMQTTGGD